MRNPKIALVAEWDGWCSPCATERPLVLTRTGRPGLRAWLTGALDSSTPLTLTCRLCGVGVPVPAEQDDPPLPDDDQLAVHAVDPSSGAGPDDLTPTPASVPPTTTLTPLPDGTPELAVARRTVAAALGALLAQRTTTATPIEVQPASPAGAHGDVPHLPLQRTAPAEADGLTALHALADRIELPGTRRP